MADPQELDEYYRDAIPAHVYALADLEEPYWTPSRWYRRGDAVVGLVALPGAERPTVYAVSTRAPEATLGLLADLLPGLSPGTLITGPTGVGAMVSRSRPVAWAKPHQRFHLARREHVSTGELATVMLGRCHLDALHDLYDVEPGAAFFLPEMIDDRSFVGVVDADEPERLVAAAGTHVLSEAKRCAAIGAVYTRPTHRGRGLGIAVTAAVVARIADRADVIGLNVASDNTPARRIYERLGFTPILDYEECELAPATHRDAPSRVDPAC